VIFDVNIEEYSFFKIAKKGQRFLIIGKIKEINNNTFTINIEKVYKR
jgi:hypothetical protein